jgi:AraC-like DNA-binding protein
MADYRVVGRPRSWRFCARFVPNLHKTSVFALLAGVTDPKRLADEVFAAAPGLAVAEKLFEALDNVVFCIKGRDRRYVSVNAAFVSRANVPNKAALLGRTAREVFPAYLAAGYEQQDDLVFSTGMEVHDKLEMITNQDGTTGWYLAQKVPVHDARQKLVALAGISCDLGAVAVVGSQLGALAGAIETIQNDYARPIRIGDLARDAGMSMSQFERKMRAVLRLSPRQLLTRARIEAAARALRESSDALGSIACDCGFYDQAMFCRQFRSATGLTPGQYRSQHAKR